jgi:hypothetical protein
LRRYEEEEEKENHNQQQMISRQTSEIIPFEKSEAISHEFESPLIKPKVNSNN